MRLERVADEEDSLFVFDGARIDLRIDLRRRIGLRGATLVRGVSQARRHARDPRKPVLHDVALASLERSVRRVRISLSVPAGRDAADGHGAHPEPRRADDRARVGDACEVHRVDRSGQRLERRVPLTDPHGAERAGQPDRGVSRRDTAAARIDGNARLDLPERAQGRPEPLAAAKSEVGGVLRHAIARGNVHGTWIESQASRGERADGCGARRLDALDIHVERSIDDGRYVLRKYRPDCRGGQGRTPHGEFSHATSRMNVRWRAAGIGVLTNWTWVVAVYSPPIEVDSFS
jgi:hypothetical protein